MIVCAGEALIDMLPVDLGNGETGFRPRPGGSLMTTAVALGRLGAPAGFLQQMSDDLFGDQLRAAMEAANVDHSLSPVVSRPTTLAFVHLVDGHARYTFFDEGSAARTMTEADLPTLPDAAVAVHLGGISLMPDPGGAALEALALREAPRRVVSLDPNIRANFTDDPDRHRERIERMMAAAHIIKLSDEDLDWLEPGADPDGFAAARLAAGTALVAVTRGSEGAVGYTAAGAVHVPAVRAEVVDTVGAGDTFNAGLLHSLHAAGRLRRDRIADVTEAEAEAALRFAARAAAHTVGRAGADPPWMNEL